MHGSEFVRQQQGLSHSLCVRDLVYRDGFVHQSGDVSRHPELQQWQWLPEHPGIVRHLRVGGARLALIDDARGTGGQRPVIALAASRMRCQASAT